mmetsp:Transcript_8779/g.24767  ORF Transcript_8779/g.24767 Transcript_8779/m.24767 type:complete len:245 (+) Transcript_8779:1120-1854(+)
MMPLVSPVARWVSQAQHHSGITVAISRDVLVSKGDPVAARGLLHRLPEPRPCWESGRRLPGPKAVAVAASGCRLPAPDHHPPTPRQRCRAALAAASMAPRPPAAAATSGIVLLTVAAQPQGNSSSPGSRGAPVPLRPAPYSPHCKAAAAAACDDALLPGGCRRAALLVLRGRPSSRRCHRPPAAATQRACPRRRRGRRSQRHQLVSSLPLALSKTDCVHEQAALAVGMPPSLPAAGCLVTITRR